jgi:ribosomal protein L7Ae-like RNA K-turn-binding protein
MLISEKNSNSMICWLYRSNEVEDSHIVSKMIQAIKDKNIEHYMVITEDSLGNLSVPEFNQVRVICYQLVTLPRQQESW